MYQMTSVQTITAFDTNFGKVVIIIVDMPTLVYIISTQMLCSARRGEGRAIGRVEVFVFQIYVMSIQPV